MKPPYGRITAIDLNTGDHVWVRANGPGLFEDPALKQYFTGWTGHTGRTGPLVTKTLLFCGEGPHEPRVAKKVLRAWNKANGDVVAEIALPGWTLGPPITYMAGEKQFIVCGMGIARQPHKLVALALP
jgi:quinoprotein glucose dehydrogenase